MLRQTYTTILFAYWLFVFVSAAPVQASTLNLALLPPENQSFREAKQEIKIEFPFSILDNITTQLALEIDSIDVSSMVRVDDRLIIFTPPSPLVVGIHEMRLVEYAINGDIIELGNWTFEIRQSATFREQKLSIGAAINNSYLADSDSSEGEADVTEYSADGSANITYSASNENAALNFTGDLLYVEAEENAVRGEQVDLGEYLLGIDLGKNTHFDVGHHAINHNSLIYNGFNRRGLSGRFTLPSLNSALQIFSSRTGDLQGFTRGLGVEDEDNRTSGITLDYQPFSHNPELLTFSTSYISGKRKDEDFTMGMPVEESSGEATSIALDSQLLDKKLRVRLEAAQSEFDFDGDSSGLDKERDNAYRFITQYAAQAIGSSETPVFWDISLEKIIVEPNFYSLSNSHLASDRDFTQLTNNITKGPWLSQLILGYEEDNLDNRFDSTINTSSASFIIEYTQANTANDTSSLLGIPTYRLSYVTSKQNQEGIELDQLMVPIPENENETLYVELFSEFVYERGSWSLTFSNDELDSNPLIQSDSSTQSAIFSSNFNVNESHSIGIDITSSTTKEDEANLRYDELIYNLNFNSNFKRLGINTYFAINYEKIEDEISGPPTDEFNRLVLGASLSKQLLRAKDLFPGIDLRLRGSYSDTDDRSSFDDDSDFYEIFLDLNFYWDINRPRIEESL